MQIQIKNFQTKLNSISSEKTRVWWENYLRQEIKFRGVGIPLIRQLLNEWYKKEKIMTWAPEDQFDLALLFFEQSYAEDKLTGILILQLFLADILDHRITTPKYESMFKAGHIFDWNTCDWFCVRVLGPMIEREGQPAANVILGWQHSKNLWQARSSVVAFVTVKQKSDYLEDLSTACSTLIKRPERFAKTAVGWVLREISKFNHGFVLAFAETNLQYFSIESMRNALKYLPEKSQFLSKLKSL